MSLANKAITPAKLSFALAILIYLAFALAFFADVASAKTPALTLREDASRLQLHLSAQGMKAIKEKEIVRVLARSEGTLFPLKNRGKKIWTSPWRQKPTLLENLYDRKVALVFHRKNKDFLLFKITLPTKAIDPIDPADPTDPVDPDPIDPGVKAPGLRPMWQTDITDYTITCDDPVNLSVNINTPVSLNGETPRSDAFLETLDLLPGQAFTLEGAFGKQHFRCRPKDLPLPEVSGKGTALYLIAPTLFGSAPLTNYAMVLDERGTPLWWYKAPLPLILDFNMPLPGKFSWVQARNGPGGFSASDYTLQGLDGSFLDSVSAVGFGADHHDLQPTSDGGWLLIGYVARDCPAIPAECIDLSPWGGPSQATAIDGWVQKINAQGNIVWTWKSQDHIEPAESADWIASLGSGVTLDDGRKGFDIVHFNSVEEDGNGFIFSARHLDAVYRVADPGGSGAIDWKIGGTTTAESLHVADDPLASDPLGGQHDARVLDDGTVTIHDNGTGASRAPRMVRYEIDPLANTATLVSAISDPEITASFCCGGGRILPDGDGWAVSWGANNLVAEYDLLGARRLAMRLPHGKHSYRVVPVSRDTLTPAALRAGMDSQSP